MTNKGSILIVDDNLSQSRTMELILGRKGYSVTAARDGLEAIEKVSKNRFEIIFMDIKMPVMNGVETFKKIKEIRSDAAVVMMTAYAVEDLVREAILEGAFGVLYKPLNIEKAIGLVEEAKGNRLGGLILIVDDDESICATFRLILTQKGYRVHVVNTGEEAIEQARRNSFSVIFLDMKLPTINGLETYFAIRQINPEVVAIIITGYRHEMSELIEQAMRGSAYACLDKPVDMAEVLAMTEKIIERKRGVQE